MVATPSEVEAGASGGARRATPGGALAQLDGRLAQLTQSLRARDVSSLQAAADELVAALETARPLLSEPGALTPALRQQLAFAVGRVAAHREALARATASVDRAISVLLPASVPAATYSSSGHAERAGATGSAWA